MSDALPLLIPTPTGAGRAPVTQAERAFAGAWRTARGSQREAAAAAATLKDARKALDSAVAHHGPAAEATKAARGRWKQAREALERASRASEAAEQGLERTLAEWAAESAQQARTHRVVRPSESRARCEAPARTGDPWPGTRG